MGMGEGDKSSQEVLDKDISHRQSPREGLRCKLLATVLATGGGGVTGWEKRSNWGSNIGYHTE